MSFSSVHNVSNNTVLLIYGLCFMSSYRLIHPASFTLVQNNRSLHSYRSVTPNIMLCCLIRGRVTPLSKYSPNCFGVNQKCYYSLTSLQETLETLRSRCEQFWNILVNCKAKASMSNNVNDVSGGLIQTT